MLILTSKPFSPEISTTLRTICSISPINDYESCYKHIERLGTTVPQAWPLRKRTKNLAIYRRTRAKTLRNYPVGMVLKIRRRVDHGLLAVQGLITLILKLDSSHS